MGEVTNIAWTDHTFNPWWGCERVSPGCQHCYAETFAKRTGNSVWGKNAPRRFFGDKHWAEPLRWNAAAAAAGRPALVFCASMADVFEDRADLAGERARLFELIEATPHLIWQLLTKRPQNVRSMVPGRWLWTATVVSGAGAESVPRWPANAWIGTTVEDGAAADVRIPELLRLPAPVRFLSCEPLLGSVDLSRFLGLSLYRDAAGGERWERDSYTWGPDRGISWVIVGGESGPGHRPLDLDAARLVVAQCTAAEVPVFFKQVGGHHPTSGGDLLDGVSIKQFPPSADRTVSHG